MRQHPSTAGDGFGPNPWQQAHWDARAAGNFIGGGAGSGLIVASALAGASDAAFTALMLAGLALIALGLTSVWLEIGRPWRALNVFRHPQRSWMSREAIVAALLMPTGLATVLAQPALVWPTAVLALVFLFCQSRMLPAARGIPAWRSALTAPLVIVTGLAEGLGLFVFIAALRGVVVLGPALALGALVLLRIALWFAYRRATAASLAPRANRALDGAGRWLQIAGTLLPLAALAFALLGAWPQVAAVPLLALAGLASALAGSGFKFVLITRAGFNQGFALVRPPVRGVRRSAPPATR